MNHDSNTDIRNKENDSDDEEMFRDEEDEYEFLASSNDENHNAIGTDDNSDDDHEINNDMEGCTLDDKTSTEEHQCVFLNLEYATRKQSCPSDNKEDYSYAYDASDSSSGTFQEFEETVLGTKDEKINRRSVNTRSFDGSGTSIMSDYDAISMDGTSYHLCRRCTYINQNGETLCQGCATALVTNPCMGADELMAFQIHLRDLGLDLTLHIDTNQTYLRSPNERVTLLLNKLRYTLQLYGARYKNPNLSRFVSQPELHSVAATFVEHYMTVCGLFANLQLGIALYYHATTTTMCRSDHLMLSSSTACGNGVVNVVIQNMIQECKSPPARAMFLSKAFQTFAVDPTVARTEVVDSSDNSDSMSFRYLFIVAAITACPISSSGDPKTAHSEHAVPPQCVRPDATTVQRNGDNPMLLLPLTCFDISPTSCTWRNVNERRLGINAQHTDFLYRDISRDCWSFFDRINRNYSE